MQPGAPGVVARAAGERDVGSRACGGDGDVGADASLMRDERVRLGERGDGTLADEVDDGLAEAEGSHALRLSSAAVPPVSEETIQLDDQPVFLRRAGGRRRADPLPARPADVVVRLARAARARRRDRRGPAGLRAQRQARRPRLLARGPRARSSTGCSMSSGIDRVRLCLHDWGAAVGLAWAAREPERVERLVVVNGVPLLAGFRWRGWARASWACRSSGPVAVGFATKRMVRRLARRASGGASRWPSRSSRAWPSTSTSARSARCCACCAARRRSRWLRRAPASAAIAAPALVLRGARGPVDLGALRRGLRGEARRSDARDDRGRRALAVARQARARRADRRATSRASRRRERRCPTRTTPPQSASPPPWRRRPERPPPAGDPPPP